jgi:SAM-dependent methyltransferase
MDESWAEYYKACSGKPPHTLVTRSIGWLAGPRDTAIDLGCGVGAEANFLAGHFSRVIAVDQHLIAMLELKRCVEFVETRMEAFRPVAPIDFGISIRALWYLTPEKIAQVLQTTRDALRPGGMFVFNLAGPHGTLARQKMMHGFTGIEIKRLCSGWATVYIREAPLYYKPGAGKTHRLWWHEWEIVLRKSG